MKNFKKITAIILCLGILFCLAACGGNGEVKCMYNELIDIFASGEGFNKLTEDEYDV